MAFDLTMMDLASSHEQALFDDRDITIRVVPVGDVPIVEFSADQSCDDGCDLIDIGRLTYQVDRRSYYHRIAMHRCINVAAHQAGVTVLDDAAELTGRGRRGIRSTTLRPKEI
jgi:hypothetical protein